MARPLRLDNARAVHHLMARGRERSSIFRDDEDRQEFLLLPGSISSDEGREAHAYRLMSNLCRSGRTSCGDGWAKVHEKGLTP